MRYRTLLAAAVAGTALLTSAPAVAAGPVEVTLPPPSSWTECPAGKAQLGLRADVTLSGDTRIDLVSRSTVLQSFDFTGIVPGAGSNALVATVPGLPFGPTSQTDLRLRPAGWTDQQAFRVNGFLRHCDGWTSPQAYNAEPGGALGYVPTARTRTSAKGAAVHVTPVGELWIGRTGGHALTSPISDLYNQLRADAGPLGLPTTSVQDWPGERASQWAHFEGGRIYSHRWGGTTAMWGEIAQKWIRLGGLSGFLGMPFTSEQASARGRVQDFAGGGIWWSPRTGAREVHGEIHGLYRSLGADGGWLGLPTSDEFGIPGGRRSNFQGGHITWSPTRGAVAVRS